MRILTSKDILTIIKQLAAADADQIVGGQSKKFEALAREYIKDLCVTINAHEQLNREAQQMIGALVLQQGGTADIPKEFMLAAKNHAITYRTVIFKNEVVIINTTPLDPRTDLMPPPLFMPKE